jgi:hypothetical protein
MRASLVAIILGFASPLAADELEPLGSFEWDTELIVGLSGLEVSDDGTSFTAIGDRGFWLAGQFERKDGLISGIRIDDLRAILGNNGYPVAARQVGDWLDAEGLAIADDGTAWISFERWAHVSIYRDGLTGSGAWIEDHPTFYDHADNWQLEALAISPNGTLYAFSEKPLSEGFPIYRLDGGTWTIDGFLPEQDVFSIVGADFDTNGDLYLLERKLVVGLWWQNRIRRVRLDGSRDEILWTGERGEYLNLEGIALWRDDIGLRMTLVADDNGDLDDPSQFVEFRLTR